MLICNLKGWKNFTLDESLLEELEDFFKCGMIIPIKSFGQYVILLSSQAKYNAKVAKYFGTDLAKSLTSIETILTIRSRESMITLLIDYIKVRTGSVISTPGFGTYVYLYDRNTQKLIHTFDSYRLDDYQERIDIDGTTQYVSRFDNILVMMTKNYKKEHNIDEEINIMKSISSIN